MCSALLSSLSKSPSLSTFSFAVNVLLQASNDQRNIKRHPTIKEDVVIGSGAQVLGPIVVGRGARIGANAVITKDVSENAVMVGIPARSVGIADSEFKPYGITSDSDKKSDNE